MSREEIKYNLAIFLFCAVMVLGLAKFQKFVDAKADKYYVGKIAKK